MNDSTSIPPELASALETAKSLHTSGRLPEAIARCREILVPFPECAPVYLLLGSVLADAGDDASAITAYQNAIAFDPRNAPSQYSLGNILMKYNQFEAAADAFGSAIDVQPEFVEAYFQLSVCVLRITGAPAAEVIMHHVVALKPGWYEAWLALANMCRSQTKLVDAYGYAQKAKKLRPDSVEAIILEGLLLTDLGEIVEAQNRYRRALEIDPGSMVAASNLLLCSNYRSTMDPTEVFDLHRQWASLFEKETESVLFPRLNSTDAVRPLRVGYVSADFRTHSVAYFIESLLEHHDKNAVESICYSGVESPDCVTKRIQAVSGIWHDTAGMTDVALVDIIRKDRIDILVDLAGHTGNRLGVFGKRAAPVQITYLGYPNTTGLTNMDYRFTDAIADPQSADEHHTEQLIRLPRSFLCYKPPLDIPEVQSLPFEKNGYVTFGSFNTLAKISDSLIAHWSSILRDVAMSRIVLKVNVFNDPRVREQYHRLFEKHGVSRDRVDLLGRIVSVAGHLDVYNQIDIALDSFRYNGTTTTCEALLMGVPVVTVMGNVHAARVGASLLTAVGLPELIASSADEYCSIAKGLAANTQLLNTVRTTLREKMRSSVLCDAQRFARGVESAYQEIWNTKFKNTVA